MATNTIITYIDGTTSSIVNDDGILTWEETKGGKSSTAANSTIKSVIIGTDTSSISKHAFYKCSSLTSIEIPNSVTSIGSNTFAHCTSLLSIEIPNSVSSIDNRAFWCCYSLTSIEIPNSVSSISSDAFLGCRSLLSIEIPNSISSINSSVFQGCSSLTSVTIPNSVTSISSYAFAYCTSLTSVTYNKSISEISSMTNKYWGLQAGTKIYGSDGIITVHSSNTETVEVLHTIITYTNNTTSSIINTDGILTWQEIKGEGNQWNTNTTIKSVTIGTDTLSIDSYAFYNCISLSSVYFDKPMSDISSMSNKYWYLKTGTLIYASDGIITVTGNDPETFEEYTPTIITYTDNTTSSIVNKGGILTQEETKGEGNQYNENTTIKSVVIGTDTSSIYYSAFYNCTSLSSVTIPNSVTSIGIDAFFYCTSLLSIEIPNSISSIGDGTFNSCISLSSIEIPNSVTSIGDYVFWGCCSLTSIEIPEIVESIGDYAFRDCTSLSSVIYNKPMSEIANMTYKYWELQTGTKIYASDGIITVTGSATGTTEKYLSSYGPVLNTRLILKNDTAANFSSSKYLPLQGEPIAISTSTIGWDIVIGNGSISGSSLSSAGLTYKLSSRINTVSSTLNSRINTVSSGISSQVSNIIQPITNVGFNTWEGDAGFYREKFYSTSATLNLGGNGRIHGMSALTYDAVEAGQYGKSILIPWEVASNNFKTKFLVGKTWMSNRGLGNLPYCQPMMPTDSDYPYINAIPNLESSPLYWGGPMLYSYENNGTTSAMAIQMPWDEVSSYGQEINCPIQGLTNYKLKATKLASQHWVSGAIQQIVLPSMVELSNALTSHIVSCNQADIKLSTALTSHITACNQADVNLSNALTSHITACNQADVNLSNKLSVVEQSMPKFLVRDWED